MTGDHPEPRHSHSANLWSNYMVIAGGLQDDLLPLNSVHLFDLESHVWKRLQCDVQPRYGSCLCVVLCDCKTNFIIIGKQGTFSSGSLSISEVVCHFDLHNLVSRFYS